VPALSRYVVAATLIWAFDLLLRALKTRVQTARLVPLCAAQGLVRIELPRLNAGWRAGQHVRLRVLSRQMGWWGWAEAHPFTIACATADEAGLVLLSKSAGGWTNRLWDLAKAGPYTGATVGSPEKVGGEPARVRVLVEGPYGGVGHAVPASCAGALLVAGGGGISFALALLAELVAADERGACALTTLELLWVVPEPLALDPFLATFEELLSRVRRVQLRVRVCYTRALLDADVRLYLPPGVKVEPGRGQVRKALDGVLRRTAHAHAQAQDQDARARGVFVGVCGPRGMCEDVARAVGGVDGQLREDVGGVEMHAETFGV
jgi:ferric-chelate reductase